MVRLCSLIPSSPPRPTGPTVSIILSVATAGYLIAIALAWTTIQGGRERRVRS